MEQKDYKLEIIDELLKNKIHIRELAKRLNINHMTIARKIKELLKENAVDFTQEGKNKVFFLRKSIEADSYIFITENYKLIRLLMKYPELRNIVERIKKDKKIKLALLFGSYAKGTAKTDSDIDVYIETRDKKIKQILEMTNSNLSVKIGKFAKSSLLIKEIEKNHIILKGVDLYYEKIRFFE